MIGTVQYRNIRNKVTVYIYVLCIRDTGKISDPRDIHQVQYIYVQYGWYNTNISVSIENMATAGHIRVCKVDKAYAGQAHQCIRNIRDRYIRYGIDLMGSCQI